LVADFLAPNRGAGDKCVWLKVYDTWRASRGDLPTVVTLEDNHILKHAKAALHLKWAYSAAADVLNGD
jgi:hypothetical protein